MGDAMMDIELIYNLLDWKNSEKVQAEGIEMAAEIPGVQLFLQPNTEKKENKQSHSFRNKYTIKEKLMFGGI